MAMVAIVVVTRGSAQERRQKNRLIRCRWEPAKNETTVAEWLRQPAGQEREREEREQLMRDIADREQEAEARDRAHAREKELGQELVAGLREQV